MVIMSTSNIWGASSQQVACKGTSSCFMCTSCLMTWWHFCWHEIQANCEVSPSQAACKSATACILLSIHAYSISQYEALDWPVLFWYQLLPLYLFNHSVLSKKTLLNRKSSRRFYVHLPICTKNKPCFGLSRVSVWLEAMDQMLTW